MTDKALTTLLEDHLIILYDGTCGFCDTSIQFILKRKPSENIRFAALQSPIGSKIRQILNIDESLDSIIVVSQNSYFKKSSAIFLILKHLRSPWRFLCIFNVLPQEICDFLYDLIATNRYRLSSQKCIIPTLEERSYFLS